MFEIIDNNKPNNINPDAINEACQGVFTTDFLYNE